MSARTAWATPGYWTLTATSRPSCRRRAVDLADRGGGDRRLVELGERVAELLAELRLDDLAHVREAHLRRRVAQLAELALELLAVLLGHEADVEERHHLPELHRRALHRPQRGDDLLRGLDVAALERLLLALLAARQVGGRRAELARRLAGGEAGDPRRARDARGRDPVLGHAPRLRGGRRCRPWLGRGGVRRHARRRRRARPTGVGVSVGVSRRRRRSASASSSSSGRGRRRRRRRRRGVLGLAAEEGRAVLPRDRVAEDRQLGGRDDDGGDREGEQAGDERQHDASCA